ncbi:hypothetical protein [Streptomyces sp. 1222.5]
MGARPAPGGVGKRYSRGPALLGHSRAQIAERERRAAEQPAT